MTSPTSTRNAYDLTLTDSSTNKLDLILCNRSGKPDAAGWQRANSPKTSLKITSGNEGYGDFELPFSSIVQSDFSGGRGARDFEKDTTRYADGYRCDTNRANELRCGPLATQGSGFGTPFNQTCTATHTDDLLLNDSPLNGRVVTATKFVLASGMTARSIYVSFGINSPVQTITATVIIYSHHAGNNAPDAVLATSSLQIGADYNGSVYSRAIEAYRFPTNVVLTNTTYWLSIELFFGVFSPVDYNCDFYYGTNANSIIKTDTGSSGSWATPYTAGTGYDTFPFEINPSGGSGRTILFDYRGRKMGVTQSDDYSAPCLYIQGYHGMATSNSSDKTKLNTTLHGIATDALAGKYARIESGPGSAEETPWRKIVSNIDSSSHCIITVAPAWNVTHTTDTEFVIQGCTNWQAITSTSGSGTLLEIKGMATYLDTPVTDVLVVDDIIYFAQGEVTGKYIARTRFNAGVWADMAADGTNQATFLELVQDDKGVKKIWRALREASTVSEAPKVAWGTSMTFTAALVCGDTSSQITGLLAAKIGGPMLPVVFKETEFGAVSGSGADKIYDTYYQFPEARDDFNGRSAVQPDLYLWFSLMDGIERYYDQRLDDIGPNRDEGLPMTRKGRVAAMVKYFSQMYIAYDAGWYGYSSILRNNGVGWCEVYRGTYGRRIRALNIDVLPDLDNADRLWFSEEEDIYYVPIGLDPDKVNGYTYFTGSQLETAWIYGPYRDVTKYWDTLAVFSQNLTSTVTVTVDYKTDNATTWTALPTTYTASPVQENNIATLRNVTGKRIKFRLTLATPTNTLSPIVTALRVNAVIRVKPKAIWNVTCTVTDSKEIDRQNQTVNGAGVSTAVGRLEGWSDGTTTPIPLTATGYHAMIDNKRGFVDNVSMSPIEVITESGAAKILALISFQFIEV
jgi:hypothetical protein